MLLWKIGLGNDILEKLRLVMMVFNVNCVIDRLIIVERVNIEFISCLFWKFGCCLVYVVLRCSDWVFIVSVVNNMLLVLVIVWLGWCRYVVLIWNFLNYKFCWRIFLLIVDFVMWYVDMVLLDLWLLVCFVIVVLMIVW